MPKVKKSFEHSKNEPTQLEEAQPSIQEEWQKLVNDIANEESEESVSENEPSGASSDEDDTVKIVISEENTVRGTNTSNNVNSSDSSDDEEEKPVEQDCKPVWIDEDDVFTTQEVLEFQGRKVDLGPKAANDYRQTLLERHKAIMGVPEWAKKKKTNVKPVTEIGSLIRNKKSLKKGVLEIQALKNLNRQTYTEGSIIKSVLFHPNSTVGLVAGINGVVSLFQVDGKENNKLQSITYRRFPISCAAFLKNGEQFMIGSRHHKYFYSHDLIAGKSQQVSNTTVDLTNMKNFSVTPDGRIAAVCGRFGEIYLLAAASKEHIATLRMNGEVNALGFYDNKMFSHGSDGEVYIWDLSTRDCIHKFIDDGCIAGTSIAAAPSGKLLACGSSSGVVNIYDLERCHASKEPAPLKTIYNLVTEVDSMKFNATSEILCFASQPKNNAIKMLHCPSMSIFSNFPSFTAKFHRIQCLDFSPNSGFLAFGDNAKTAHLFRLKHYGNY